VSQDRAGDDSKRHKVRTFMADWGGWIVAAVFLLVLIVLFAVLVGTGILKTGFNEYIPSSPNAQRAKTLWDWMDLLLVPLALALGAGLFTWMTNKRESEAEERRAQAAREAEERRAEADREIAEDRSRDAALQTYLDRVSALLRSEWRESGMGFLEANIIRAQTLTALRQLDGRRNDLLFRFLRESGLIVKGAVVTLKEADQSGANLSGADLQDADLGYADLSGADLSGACLNRARLRRAILRGADLHDASLYTASLQRAYLRDADLSRAYLEHADLTGAGLERAILERAMLNSANLSEARLVGADLSKADLSYANLEGAEVTQEQLAQAKTFEGATLPDGAEYAGEAPAEAKRAEADKPKLVPAEPEPQDARGQTDQPDDLEAGGGDHA
jgi:uncharacterized protein YjbI with pentapeptide repeats